MTFSTKFSKFILSSSGNNIISSHPKSTSVILAVYY
jgi:hypothetical protein